MPPPSSQPGSAAPAAGAPPPGRPADPSERFDKLLDHLRGGRPLPVQHRSAWQAIVQTVNTHLLKIVAVGAAPVFLYLLALAAVGWYRDQQTDAWTGPDATVSSGQRLAGCAPIDILPSDPDFPNWVRYNGRIYARTSDIRPMGSSNVGPGLSYVPTDYAHDGLVLYLVNTPDAGATQEVIALRESRSPGGGIYQHVAACDR
jgi:hypothetical protein